MDPDEILRKKFKSVAECEYGGELLFNFENTKRVIEVIEQKHFIILGLDFWISNGNSYIEINSTKWDDINSGKDASHLTILAAKNLLKNGLPDNADFVSFVLKG